MNEIYCKALDAAHEDFPHFEKTKNPYNKTLNVSEYQEWKEGYNDGWGDRQCVENSEW